MYYRKAFIVCISFGYTMNKLRNKLIIEDVKFYFEKEITRFGNSAKIDCPKKYIGNKAIVIIEE